MASAHARHDKYFLNRSPDEIERLLAVDILWELNLGYVVHPTVARYLPPRPHVADIGTGMGCYLMDVRKNIAPDGTFTGFDISDAMFPPRNVLPPNVHLAIHDAREAYPPIHLGSYDLVHLRSLAAGLDRHEWDIVLRNAITLLKPSGVLQWDEADIPNIAVCRGDPKIPCGALKHMLREYLSRVQDRLSGWTRVQEALNFAGMKGIGWDIVTSDRVPKTRKDTTLAMCNEIFGWANKRLESPDNRDWIWTNTDLVVLSRDCDIEMQSGGYLRFNIWVFWGFKG